MAARVFTYIRTRHYKDGTVAKIEEASVTEAFDFRFKTDHNRSVKAEIAIPTIHNWNTKKFKCPKYGGVISYKVGKFDNGIPE